MLKILGSDKLQIEDRVVHVQLLRDKEEIAQIREILLSSIVKSRQLCKACEAEIMSLYNCKLPNCQTKIKIESLVLKWWNSCSSSREEENFRKLTHNEPKKKPKKTVQYSKWCQANYHRVATTEPKKRFEALAELWHNEKQNIE